MIEIVVYIISIFAIIACFILLKKSKSNYRQFDSFIKNRNEYLKDYSTQGAKLIDTLEVLVQYPETALASFRGLCTYDRRLGWTSLPIVLNLSKIPDISVVLLDEVIVFLSMLSEEEQKHLPWVRDELDKYGYKVNLFNPAFLDYYSYKKLQSPEEPIRYEERRLKERPDQFTFEVFVLRISDNQDRKVLEIPIERKLKKEILLEFEMDKLSEINTDTPSIIHWLNLQSKSDSTKTVNRISKELTK